MQSINPATGKKIKNYRETSFKEITVAVRRAQAGFEEWREVSFECRAAKLRLAAEILRRNTEEYSRLMAEEMGKPVSQGRAEIDKCAWVCEFYAQEAAEFLAPRLIKTEARKSFVTFQPLGVVLAVMPWNFPFWQVFRCAAPTLMAGNAVILKHASNVCGCSRAIGDVFREAGLSEVFQSVLISSDKVNGLIEDPIIKAVSLTGSTGAGQSIAAQAGAVLKKTVLELGGSDPYLILEDADLAQAAEICAASRLINAGQSCISAKRFIVVKSRVADFESFFLEKMRAARMGSPLEETTTLGPLARHDLRESVHRQVRQSVKKGARVLCGGEIPEGPGAFYPPTVLTNVKKNMPAYEEEIFGPVASIISVADEEKAVAAANDTVFGLGAAVFTRDLSRGEEIAARQLQAGCCCVNDSVKSDPRLPFGGIKDSGYGRELSDFGIHEFVNIKTVVIK